MHHVLTINEKNPKALNNAVGSLSHMYAQLVEDYPRGAFWARKSGRDPILLANCYWKMGSKEMAVEIIGKYGIDTTRNCTIVKLWADMGEFDRAIRLAEASMDVGRPDAVYLAAGDACRLARRYPQAIAYYQKVVAMNEGAGDLKMNRGRAAASLAAIKLFDALNLTRVADGKYKSSSFAYTGPLEVEVAVKSGRIEAVKVTKHTEKQFYSSITDTTSRIIAKQSVIGIDATSGATITSEAIINATAKALAGAKQ